MSKAPAVAEHTCCGVVQEAKYAARAKRAERTKPQPWIVLKLTIFLALGIIGYTSYVYVGRFLVPMIRHYDDRAAAIGFLVAFAVLLLLMMWAYVKVVFTPPGYAKDYIPQTPRPLISPQGDRPPQLVPRLDSNFDSRPRTFDSDPESDESDTAGPMYDGAGIDTPPQAAHLSSEKPLERNVGPLDPQCPPHPSQNLNASADPLPPSLRPREYTYSATAATTPFDTRADTAIASTQPQNIVNRVGAPPLTSVRRPPTTPVLLPEYRYCTRDGLVKPYRAHHCRACGTCVLRYDHHCPWIGQCVGARNQKFFLIFTVYVLLFSTYVFATLIFLLVRRKAGVDPQGILAIAIAALFALFTLSLALSHVRMIWRNQTTVENLGARHMRERERAKAGGICGVKRSAQRRADAEWGRIGQEGNLWWLGSARRNWEEVMGPGWPGWIFPIGTSGNDGLVYVPNPRFDGMGRWRPRTQWPDGLQ